MKYVFGVGADDEAPRTIDNVGLQYGLENLLNGTLTTDRFVDVNWRIGGMDIDGVWTPQRTAADEEALATLYRTGRIADGSGSANVAEIDARTNPTDVGFHPPFHSWSWRARIDRTLGNHDNNVIWVSRGGAVPSQFDSMRAWLDAVYADTSDDPLPAKIARNKPGSVARHLLRRRRPGWSAGGTCSARARRRVWQYYSHMRWVAGWPMELDTFKCQLKPLDQQVSCLPGGELIEFTDQEWGELQQAFPTGVCDFTKPAVAHQPTIPWITFADGPGGRPLGDPPTSSGPPVRSSHHHKARLAGGARAAMRARAPPGTRWGSHQAPIAPRR